MRGLFAATFVLRSLAFAETAYGQPNRETKPTLIKALGAYVPGPRLALVPSIRAKLDLSDDQLANLHLLKIELDEMRSKIIELHRPEAFETGEKNRETRKQWMKFKDSPWIDLATQDEVLKEILGEEKLKKLKALQAIVFGPSLAFFPPLADELGITPQQRVAYGGVGLGYGPIIARATSPGPADRTALRERVWEILTSEQGGKVRERMAELSEVGEDAFQAGQPPPHSASLPSTYSMLLDKDAYIHLFMNDVIAGYLDLNDQQRKEIANLIQAEIAVYEVKRRAIAAIQHDLPSHVDLALYVKSPLQQKGADKEVATILDERQYRRLEQIWTQINGIGHVFTFRYKSKLKWTSEQIKQSEAIIEEELASSKARPNWWTADDLVSKRWAELMTPEQARVWQELNGEPVPRETLTKIHLGLGKRTLVEW